MAEAGDVPREAATERFAVRPSMPQGPGWQEDAQSEHATSEGTPMRVRHEAVLGHVESSATMQRLMASSYATAADHPEQKFVSKAVLLSFVREEEENRTRCLQFPLIVLYFVAFVMVVFQHEDIVNVASVERNIRNMIEGTSFEGLTPEFPVSGHKVMDDIDVVVDIWTFLYDAMVPLFIPEVSGVSAEDRHRVLRYNHIFGGMQLQQLRRPRVACTEEYPTLGPFGQDNGMNPLLEGFSCYPWDAYTKECFGPASAARGFCPDSYVDQEANRRLLEAQRWSSGLGRQLFGPQHAAKVRGRSWEALSGAYMGNFEGGLYTVPLHEHEGLEEARMTLRRLQSRMWLDTATSWFGVKMFLMNPDLAVYSHVIINVWFPPSGELVPAVIITTFPAEPYLDMSKLAMDAVWLVLWLHLVVRSFVELVRAIFTHTVKAYASDFWHWLDWLSALGGLVIAICWAIFLVFLESLKARTLEVAGNRPTSGSMGADFASEAQARAYEDDADRLHAEAATMAAFLMVYRTFICWYTLLIALRFFQAFLAQPRLAMVTRTVQRSLEDIAHFFIVLILVYFSFAVAGMFLFGHRMLEFSSLGIALNQCFLIMLGSFEYEELAVEHPWSAAIWFWNYVVLVSLIMLNMALAIVMDIYSEVKADADDSDDMWTQTKKMIRGLWSRRGWVRLPLVAESVEHADPDHPKLNAQLLMNAVEGLGPAQAEELIGQAQAREEKMHDRGVSMSDAMKMVGWIKLAVQKIERQMEQIAKMEKEEAALLRPQSTLEALQFGDGAGDVLSLDPAADGKLRGVQRRLTRMEEFLSESMATTVGRGKEMRNKLVSIEGLLQGQQELAGGPIRPREHPSSQGSPTNIRTVTFSA